MNRGSPSLFILSSLPLLWRHPFILCPVILQRPTAHPFILLLPQPIFSCPLVLPSFIPSSLRRPPIIPPFISNTFPLQTFTPRPFIPNPPVPSPVVPSSVPLLSHHPLIPPSLVTSIHSFLILIPPSLVPPSSHTFIFHTLAPHPSFLFLLIASSPYYHLLPFIPSSLFFSFLHPSSLVASSIYSFLHLQCSQTFAPHPSILILHVFSSPHHLILSPLAL